MSTDRAVPAPRGPLLRAWSPLPGFNLALGLTLLWAGFLVVLPLAALVLRPWELGLAGVWDVFSQPRTLAALRLSFLAALFAALLNLVFGTLVAWAITRYKFPGRRLIDALVDLPFALPTAVAGIALAAIYAPNGVIGSLFAPLDIKIAYTPLGVLVALIFVGFPFVVRAVQPVLEDLEPELEEAAAVLGAGRLRVIARVVLPALLPAMLSGFSLALARAVGEYGSVIFIAGNIPFVSEIAPLLIVIRLEEFDYAGAAAVGLAMLLASFAILLALNLIQLALSRKGR